jgi:hypothetical protein
VLCIFVIAVRICRITFVSALHRSGLGGVGGGFPWGWCIIGLGGRCEWASIGLGPLGGVCCPIGAICAYAIFDG